MATDGKTTAWAGHWLGAYVLCVALWTCWATWTFMVRSSAVGLDGAQVFTLFDDGMISMRYARMLVEGFGLVWNPGEYVEGYTNPLWTLVMAAVIALTGTSLVS